MSEFKVVPCEKCEEEINTLEEDGLWVVLGCEPIEGDPNSCRIEYRLNI